MTMDIPSEKKQTVTSPRANPRRQPPNLSVSLRHETSPRARVSAAGTRSHRQSPGVSPSVDNDSAGGNGTSQSAKNSQKWFNKANNHPQVAFSQLIDDEPPYFLPPGSSRESAQTRTRQTYGKLHDQPNTSHYRSAGSVDSFRGVIDDLTIENKRLKERLKKLERTHSPHLDQDRLFEVTIHGLSARKRRQLEETLRDFTATLDESSSSDSSKKSLKDRGQVHALQEKPPKRSTGSSGSNGQLVDSAYASMSNFAATSTSNLHSSTSVGKLDREARHENVENVKHFLESIPGGLLPSNRLTLTEKQKKRLVVQRLEQLFTGKQAVAASDTQTQQQQEVSNLAAKADDLAASRATHVEGLREAHMLPSRIDDSKPGKLSSDESQGGIVTSMSTSGSSGDSPSENSEDEQRPTRPLDLDPDRAQIPADNVEYLRHLGVSTPQFASEDSSDVEADAEGWIYLNLLINMAQLHIINVTPDFIRRAVQDVSSKFQLSDDGQKLRWRGGTRGTNLSNHDSTSNGSPDESDVVTGGAATKRMKMNSGRFASVPIETGQRTMLRGRTISKIPHYRPLFNHHESFTESGDTDESSLAESNSNHRRKSMAGVLRDDKTKHRSTKRPRDDGTMVFYSNAHFCTDLSGDREIPIPLHSGGAGKLGFDDRTDVLGCPRQYSPAIPRTVSGSVLPYRPFKQTSGMIQAQVMGTDELRLYANNSTKALSFEEKDSTIQLQVFEASGLGGTQPSDHFAVRVKTRRTVHPSTPKRARLTSPRPRITRILHHISQSALQSFDDTKANLNEDSISAHLASLSASSPVPPQREELPVHIEYISETFTPLEPSQLPEPSGYYEDSSTSEDMYSYSFTGSASTRPHRTFFHKSLTSLTVPDTHQRSKDSRETLADITDDEDHAIDKDVDEDDISVDMLGHIREIDPKMVAEKERDFDMRVDEVEEHWNDPDAAMSAAATIAESEAES